MKHSAQVVINCKVVSGYGCLPQKEISVRECSAQIGFGLVCGVLS